MAPKSDGSDDAAALEERVGELEDTVEKMLPSRRQAIAGGALLGGGLLGGAGASRRASAQSAAGQVGTSSGPVDLYGDLVDANTVNTDKIDTSGGYSWQDETANRAEGTWYQAPSDRDIFVSVSARADADNINMNATLDINTSQTQQRTVEEQLASTTKFDKINLYAKIPATSHYQLRFRTNTADVTIDKWNELR